MTLLKKPNEISENIIVKGLIYGQPGVGKTTLSLSAPSPVVIDADNGMYRVEKRFQVPSLPLIDYQSLIELMNSNELAPFQTIVFDTLGKLVDRIGDYLVKTNPKYRQTDGSLSMKGWGSLKIEFQKLLKLAQSKNKHLIFVAHEREEKDGDIRIVRPDVSGSSGKDILKELDFMGYIEMRGDKRSISFSPCEKFYAKNSLQLPPHITIPDTENGNEFITKQIIDRTVERLKEDEKVSVLYENVIKSNLALIDTVEDAETANSMIESLNQSEGIWDSARIAKKQLLEKTKELGMSYNRDTASFELVEAESEKTTDAPPPPITIEQPSQEQAA